MLKLPDHRPGFLSILFSIGYKPLGMWDKRISNGVIKRVIDDQLNSPVIEIVSSNVSTNFISCPVDKTKSLGIEFPCFTLTMKNVSFTLPLLLLHSVL